jgi:FixJ family two-component response regulator
VTQELLILMVEDSPDDALMTIRELVRGDYKVEWERVDTEEAMMRALWEKQHWDVILCDYNMPRFSTLRALELVQKSGLDIPFIIISGVIGETLAVEMMKAGAHDFLIKGKIGRLGAAIEREIQDMKVRKERSHVEGRLRDTLDNLMEGCQIFSFDWKCLYVNNSLMSQMHKSREELFGHTITEIYPKIEATNLFVALDQCMKERNPQRVISEIAFSDSFRSTFDLSLLPVPEGLMILSMKANNNTMEGQAQ